MAVPKKKTSPSKRGLRRAGQHHKLTPKSVIRDSENGEYTLPHRISPSGHYKGNRYFIPRAERKRQAEEEGDKA